MSKKTKTNIEGIAKYIARIHSYNLNQSELVLYNAQWVIDLVNKDKNCENKNDIISAINIMSKLEEYKNNIDINIHDKKFLTWNIVNSSWQDEYKGGHIGDYVWDLAAIINYENNPYFSDIFLDKYIQYSNYKPTLAEIYSNLYYVRVVEAIINNKSEDIIVDTCKIINQNIFNTDLLSYETIYKIGIVGY